MSLLTIFADASYDPRTRAAGYGAWAISGALPKGELFGGAIRGAHSNTHAETLALLNAVAKAHTAGWTRGVDAIMLQSDCLGALATFYHHLGAADWPVADGLPVANHGAPPAGDLRIAIELMHEALRDVRLGVRHVRGHQTRSSGRFWVNAQCDTLAREHMDTERHRITHLTP